MAIASRRFVDRPGSFLIPLIFSRLLFLFGVTGCMSLLKSGYSDIAFEQQFDVWCGDRGYIRSDGVSANNSGLVIVVQISL